MRSCRPTVSEQRQTRLSTWPRLLQANNYEAAVSQWRKAVEQGYASAQNSLGFMYLNGRGVPQDYGQALMWYRKAVEQGYPPLIAKGKRRCMKSVASWACLASLTASMGRRLRSITVMDEYRKSLTTANRRCEHVSHLAAL